MPERDVVEALLFDAFESGWFDNKGYLGEAWSEWKAENAEAIRRLRGGTRFCDILKRLSVDDHFAPEVMWDEERREWWAEWIAKDAHVSLSVHDDGSLAWAATIKGFRRSGTTVDLLSEALEHFDNHAINLLHDPPSECQTEAPDER